MQNGKNPWTSAFRCIILMKNGLWMNICLLPTLPTKRTAWKPDETRNNHDKYVTYLSWLFRVSSGFHAVLQFKHPKLSGIWQKFDMIAENYLYEIICFWLIMPVFCIQMNIGDIVNAPLHFLKVQMNWFLKPQLTTDSLTCVLSAPKTLSEKNLLVLFLSWLSDI